ncbi:MAG: LysM peptidoglycan-binding domain-containing protein [Lachnospiraceae bacterium]|nr:LysM peptidoglycan-binding domain-containing protein [Lachnospiraceae bacterium]
MEEKIVQRNETEHSGEKNRLLKLPKHIKQMGLGGNSPEIYIEDYAEGYLRRLAGSDYTECRVAVLVGEFMKSEGKRYVFIRGAIEAEEVVVDNSVCFTSEVWANVYEKLKRYFPQYEAVGWFLGGPDFLTEVTEEVRKTHTDWFGGRDRVLYRVDPVEKEAEFYLYDKGELKQWPGYCIYYEKNEEMQDYLVAGAPPSVDAGYTEPILAELSKKVGRKADTEEETAGEGPTAFEEGRREKETLGHRTEKKAGKSGSGHGAGIVAAMALLALGAYALREKDPGQAGSAGVPTLNPTPVATSSVQEEKDKDVLQANAEVKPTQSGIAQGAADGTFSEGEFIPITEEPYLTGTGQEDIPVTSALPEFTPIPIEPPAEETTVIDPDTMSLYIVQSGDTLAGICREFYGNLTRMEEVKGVNQISDENWIYAGQELYLP